MADMPKKAAAKPSHLEKEFKAEHEARLRLAAELENIQKRFAQEREQIVKFANRQLLEKLFPIFDNFYRASAHAPEVSIEDAAKLSDDELKRVFNYFEGLKMVERQMESVLVGAGLQRIATKGQPFDHNLHEAISHEPNTE